MDYEIMNDTQSRKDIIATCRICLEEDSINNMLHPCKCTGSSRYVHKGCLNEWRNITTNRDNQYKCEICNYRYKISPSRENRTCFVKTVLSPNCFYILMNIFAYLFSLILNAIDTDNNLIHYIYQPKNNDSREIDMIYWIISLGICLLVLIIYLIIGMNTIKNKKLYCRLYKSNIKLFSYLSFFVVISFVMKFYSIAVILIEYTIYNISIIHLQSIIKIRMSNQGDIRNYEEIATKKEEIYLDIEDHKLEKAIDDDINSCDSVDL